MIIKNGLVFQEDGTFVPKDIYIHKGKISFLHVSYRRVRILRFLDSTSASYRSIHTAHGLVHDCRCRTVISTEQ